jgi:hypothetical protein
MAAASASSHRRQRDLAHLENAAERHAGNALARAWRWQRMLDDGVYA